MDFFKYHRNILTLVAVLLGALAIPLLLAALTHGIRLNQLQTQLQQLRISNLAPDDPNPTSAGILPRATNSPIGATSTPTPTASVTPTVTEVEIPITGLDDPVVIEVLHLEEDNQTLIKTLFPEPLEGEFFAQVQALWSSYDYDCSISELFPDQLYCLGSRLPATNRAEIQIYQRTTAEEDAVLIFSGEFTVPALGVTPTSSPSSHSSPMPSGTPTPTLTPSSTPTPSRTPTPSSTPTPSRTPTPSSTPTNTNTPTRTPTPSNTPTPTRTPTPSNTPTPKPTKTPRPTHTPRPTKDLP